MKLDELREAVAATDQVIGQLVADEGLSRTRRAVEHRALVPLHAGHPTNQFVFRDEGSLRKESVRSRSARALAGRAEPVYSSPGAGRPVVDQGGAGSVTQCEDLSQGCCHPVNPAA